jgi:hypothetical protein
MGISVRVVVEPKWIAKQAWRRVYAETITILRAWPDPPMRFAYRTVAGIQVAVLTREVIDAEGWSICGDAHSRRFAEDNELPSEFGVEQPSEPDSEIVLREFDDDRSVHYLFANKTQGLPFHLLIVAVAMLIEHRFPRAAVVMGDLDRDDAIQAQRQLHRILGEQVPLPVCVDTERMRARLRAHLEGDALDQALQLTVSSGTAGFWLFMTLFGHLPSSPRAELQNAVTCTDVAALTEPTRRVVEEFAVEVAATAREAGLSAKFEHADGEQLLRAIAEGAQTVGVYLTEMAWDEILRASMDELRFLAALACMSSVNLGVELQPAAFESAAIRRLCLEAVASAEASVRVQSQPRRFGIVRITRP